MCVRVRERCQEVGRALFCVMAVTGSTSCHIQAAGSSARTDSHLNLPKVGKYLGDVCVCGRESALYCSCTL